ncbi:methyltransferase, TIGR04325 family [Variovorax sp. MHTC-1]|uniref:methyltransferase, TIGR04325 family n=1 Tax=Variovorax sp. MHTC-1 TaxID=2495593 RepID=UPI001C8F08A8|nr:methyltransferase, TIGR04325 family [Variovorax sp. MHTC-1]
MFDSFKAARAWLPNSPEFDDAALSEHEDVRSKKAFPYDYSFMWWLDRALRDGASSVLDIGGSIGLHCDANCRYFRMPDAPKWRVVEVPSVVLAGKHLAARNAAAALSLSESLDESIGTPCEDVWIAVNAIHYFEDARPDQLLKKCARRPQHILLSQLPLYNGEDFVTMQKIGEGAFAPVHVYNRARFIQDIKALGYTLWDRWAVQDRSMELRGYPERSFPSFTGLYFVDSTRMFKRCKPLPS